MCKTPICIHTKTPQNKTLNKEITKLTTQKTYQQKNKTTKNKKPIHKTKSANTPTLTEPKKPPNKKRSLNSQAAFL